MPKTDAGLRITLDGETYELRMSELSALDAKDFRRHVGVSLAQAIHEGSADLDVVAGLVWLARRQRERGLTYEAVARTLTYDADLDVADAGAVTEVAGDPEA